MLRPVLLAFFAMGIGCGSDCPPIDCSPAVIVSADLPADGAAALEGSIRLCHQSECLEQVVSLDPADAAPFREITFGDGTHTSARFTVAGDHWTLEAEVHPARPEGYYPGDSFSVLVRDAAGDDLFTHEGVVSEKLANDECGLPCAIQRVDL